MKTIIGSFTVKDARNRMRKVVISQELIMGTKNLVEGAVKHLNLDDEYGEKVIQTDNPLKFRLDDGGELKKIGTIKSENTP